MISGFDCTALFRMIVSLTVRQSGQGDRFGFFYGGERNGYDGSDRQGQGAP